MKAILMFLVSFFATLRSSAQKIRPRAEVERILIEYKGKNVRAKKLTVYSEIPMNIDSAWSNVKTPALLQFVAKGMIRFKPVGDKLPKEWQQGETYAVKTRVFGFIPFGGKHYLYIERIDDENFEIATKEWDKSAKVWNHEVIVKDLGHGKIYYEDSITIYGGMMTGIITSFAKRFYRHRQRRWQIVARENLVF